MGKSKGIDLEILAKYPHPKTKRQLKLNLERGRAFNLKKNVWKFVSLPKLCRCDIPSLQAANSKS